MQQVTIVIINWNSWEFLSHCLEKLQGQTFRDFKVLIIDNASDQPAPSELFSRYSNVTLIQNQANLGFAAANNQAIRYLDKSDWVGLLNPDAFPEPDWLEQLINAAKKYPDYTMFASRQLMDGNSNLLDGDGDVYHISGLIWRNGHGRRLNEAAHDPQDVFSPCAAAALYKREALMSAGGFDEDFFCYVEDVDLSFRLRLMGHRCLLVPDAVVYHVGSATTGGQHSDFSVYHGHRNLVWTFVKDMPGVLFWLLLPLHLLLNLVTIVVFIARGQGGVILRAKWDAVKGLPKAWAKRKQIQKNRKVSVREIWRVLDKRLFRRKRL
ncbi:MAG: glycosyltransferase family 2 protein [Methylobacter sp.]|nr:glycosyltransferase family 2 protein [Methylobacter sp.]